MSDIVESSLTEIAAAIRAKRVSSREVTVACLARIEQWQPKLNCFISLEAEEALAAADAADKDLANGRIRGALHGVPLAHKDMYYRAGKVSTCGSKIRRDWQADTTSTALKRLTDHGALQIGTLNMAEFAYGPTGHNAHFGHCRNPWNTTHITGGSSSGSGASVAARLVFGALGSDTGGSIRGPSGMCGLVGMKPTWTRVSRHGALPLSFSLDTVGPLVRTVEDAALMLKVIAGADVNDPDCSTEPVPDYVGALRDPVKGLRVGIPKGWLDADIDSAVGQTLRVAAKAMASAGIEVIDVTPPDLATLSAHSMIVLQAEATSLHGSWLRERAEDYLPQTRARLESGFSVPAVAYLDALRARGPALAKFVETTMAGVDAIMIPTLPITTPTIEATDAGGGPNMARIIMEIMRFMRWVNYLGVPSLSVPCGFDAKGLPIGMQLLGRPWAESTLFRIGHAYQSATAWHQRVPSI
ncbi:MAG: amidase [Betaproteobacteria bacterium]|nr:amidase [Betaproteobacteria bacterium]